MTRLTKIIGVIGGYAAISVGAYFIYFALRAEIPHDSELRPGIYAIVGPVLALFTHMSYVLFGIVSLFVLPWLHMFMYAKKAKLLWLCLFVIAWLLIGLALSTLFV